jgi:hypothetical protein
MIKLDNRLMNQMINSESKSIADSKGDEGPVDEGRSHVFY